MTETFDQRADPRNIRVVDGGQYEAQVIARPLCCAGCGGRAAPHVLAGRWVVWCPCCRGAHPLRRERGATHRTVDYIGGGQLARQVAETTWRQMMDDFPQAPAPLETVQEPMRPLDIEELDRRDRLMAHLIGKMKDGVDFGIPKDRDGRPINWQQKRLLLPGAELLRYGFGIPLQFDPPRVEADMERDGGYVLATVRAYVADPQGRVHYETTRTCSSLEPRWNAWRSKPGEEPNARRHELLDLVPERAQKRAFVDAVRHMTGADRYFIGAGVDMEETVDRDTGEVITGGQAGLDPNKCPIHGTRWFRNRNGGHGHRITGTNEYCVAQRAYGGIVTAAAQSAGIDSREGLDRWLVGHSEFEGRTWGQLTPADIVRAFEMLMEEGATLADLRGQGQAAGTEEDAPPEEPPSPDPEEAQRPASDEPTQGPAHG